MRNWTSEILFSCCGLIARQENKIKDKELRNVSSVELRQMLDDLLALDPDRQLDDLPEHFFCPLSSELLSDPVLVPSSPNSFVACDSFFIEEWLSKHHSNPFNGEKLEIDNLEIDKVLKEEMYDFLLDELSSFEEEAPLSEKPSF